MSLTTEQLFSCPYCWTTVEIAIDLSAQGRQDFFYDCESCCKPIHILLTVDGESVTNFSAEKE